MRRVRSFIPVVILLALPALGCNEAKLADAPDGAANCAAPQTIYPCKALAPGATGCTGSLGSEAALSEDVTVDASYPPGCQIIVNDPVPDEDNQCETAGTCTCLYDGGPYTWLCQK